MLSGDSKPDRSPEQVVRDGESQILQQTFETPLLNIDGDSNESDDVVIDAQDSLTQSKESSPLISTKKRQRSQETKSELVTDRESEDVPVKRRAIRRNAMIPNGVHAEIAKDVGLVFQLDAISFVPYRTPDVLGLNSDDDSDK
jgi:hypothetical protein